MTKMITWKPSVCIPGVGVKELTMEEVRDMIAVSRGAAPQTGIANQFFSGRRNNPS